MSQLPSMLMRNLHRTKISAIFAILTATVLNCAPAALNLQPASRTSGAEKPTPPHFKKIMIVVFENTDYGKAIKQPFFASLAKDGALLSNYFGLTHPSQANYLAMIGGSLFGVKSDKNVDIDALHLGDLLEAKGKTWRVYAEGYPGNCFLGASRGDYMRKHIPFLSFINVSTNAERCANIVNASQLQSDIANDTLADYSMYVPDQKNDGHDTGVAYADTWYAKTFGPLLKNTSFMNDMLLVSTFDEGSRKANNLIYTSFYGSMVKPGAVNNSRYDHINLLKMIETEFDLGNLGRLDQKAATIDGVWINTVEH